MIAAGILPKIIRHTWEGGDSIYEHLSMSDIGIIPIDTSNSTASMRNISVWKVTSDNRLTLKMTIGLPMITIPIYSYEGVIEDGINGFFALTRADWTRSFEALQDPDLCNALEVQTGKFTTAMFSILSQKAL